ncbi:MAG: phytanoyl-CoA dioxygenase family protein [Novosphingobium sp.]|nr:phytanoyl-CoA dioxygenase family protein [Novosphingobium sp.]
MTSCEAEVRAATQQESDALLRHGWVRLPGLVSSGTVDAMLDHAKALFAAARAKQRTGSARLDDCWFSWDNSVFEARNMASGPFVDLLLGEGMARLAAQLIARQTGADMPAPVRSLGGNLFCKVGGGSQSGRAIPFHQDAPSFHVTHPGFVTIWMALDEVTPEQGPLRFLDGSHRVGALETHRAGFPLDRHPALLQAYDKTPPLHYAPGDATAHDGYMLHGSGANESDRSRWGFAALYLSADAQFDDSAYAQRPHGFAEPMERYPVIVPDRFS